jgi:hypothetical protein
MSTLPPTEIPNRVKSNRFRFRPRSLAAGITITETANR